MWPLGYLGDGKSTERLGLQLVFIPEKLTLNDENAFRTTAIMYIAGAGYELKHLFNNYSGVYTKSAAAKYQPKLLSQIQQLWPLSGCRTSNSADDSVFRSNKKDIITGGD